MLQVTKCQMYQINIQDQFFYIYIPGRLEKSYAGKTSREKEKSVQTSLRCQGVWKDRALRYKFRRYSMQVFISLPPPKKK